MEPNGPSPTPEEQSNNPQDVPTSQPPVEETPSVEQAPSQPVEQTYSPQPEPVAAPTPIQPTAPVAEPALAPGQPEPLLPAGKNPGKTLGIIGFVLAFFISILGLILSIVGLVKSRKAGFKNPLAIAGIVIGALGTVFQTVFFLFIILVGFANVSVQAQVTKLCSQQGNTGQVTYQAVAYDCSNQTPVVNTSTDTTTPQ